MLTDPGMTTDQARALGDRVAAAGRNLTDIVITHGHGDHWFAAGCWPNASGPRVATAGRSQGARAPSPRGPALDKEYQGSVPPLPARR